jgi:predicted nucleic acid-binding protein
MIVIDASTVTVLARSYRLTAYDASYVALSLQMGMPLATANRALGAAAQAAKCRWKLKKN